MAKKKEEVKVVAEPEIEVEIEVIDQGLQGSELEDELEVEPEVELEVEPEDDGSQGDIDEQILLRKILVDCVGAPVFAIIRDALDDSDPDRWNNVINKWIHKDYYIVISPARDIRDGYLTELGKLHARNSYNIF